MDWHVLQFFFFPSPSPYSSLLHTINQCVAEAYAHSAPDHVCGAVRGCGEAAGISRAPQGPHHQLPRCPVSPVLRLNVALRAVLIIVFPFFLPFSPPFFFKK